MFFSNRPRLYFQACALDTWQDYSKQGKTHDGQDAEKEAMALAPCRCLEVGKANARPSPQASSYGAVTTVVKNPLDIQLWRRDHGRDHVL